MFRAIQTMEGPISFHWGERGGATTRVSTSCFKGKRWVACWIPSHPTWKSSFDSMFSVMCPMDLGNIPQIVWMPTTVHWSKATSETLRWVLIHWQCCVNRPRMPWYPYQYQIMANNGVEYSACTRQICAHPTTPIPVGYTVHDHFY